MSLRDFWNSGLNANLNKEANASHYRLEGAIDHSSTVVGYIGIAAGIGLLGMGVARNAHQMGGIWHAGLWAAGAGAGLHLLHKTGVLRALAGGIFKGMGMIAKDVPNRAISAGMFGASAAAGLAGTAIGIAKDAGNTAGVLLTGRGFLNNPVNALFPGWTRYAHGDMFKYAPNPRIVRRLATLGVAAGLASGVGTLFEGGAPAPSVFFDGRFMHHKNDMGANAYYGANVLGNNSAFAPQDMKRMAQLVAIHAF